MEADQTPEKPRPQERPAGKSAPGVALRILLTLIVGAVIGGVIYFSAAGWIPYIEQRVFQPIDSNQQQIQDLQATQQILARQQEELSTALLAVQGEQNQQLKATQESLELAVEALSARADDLESTADNTTFLSATYLPSLLTTLEARQQSNSSNLSALATAQMEAALVSQDIQLLGMLDLLSRASQALVHDNFGLAAEQLSSARNFLAESENGPSGIDTALAQELLILIDGALQDLPSRPAVAGAKLELAWQLVLETLHGRGKPGTITPTPIQPTPEGGSPTPTPN